MRRGANDDEANSIKDSTSWEKPRSLENLPGFLEAFAGESEKLDEAPKKVGSPHTLIVAGAGLRAADLVRYERSEPSPTLRRANSVNRAVRKFQKKGNTVAKLVGICRLPKSDHVATDPGTSVRKTLQARRASVFPPKVPHWDCSGHTTAAD